MQRERESDYRWKALGRTDGAWKIEVKGSGLVFARDRDQADQFGSLRGNVDPERR